MLNCIYCGKGYETTREREECEESHDLLYVPIAKADLNRLAHFIMNPDQTFLTENLVNIIFKYMRRGI